MTKHQKRLSGPFPDWIDIHIEVPRVVHETLSNDRLGEPPAVIRERVEAARQIQRERSEWIYQHVLQDKRAGGDLYRHLRCRKVYHKRYGHCDRRGSIPDWAIGRRAP